MELAEAHRIGYGQYIVTELVDAVLRHVVGPRARAIAALIEGRGPEARRARLLRAPRDALTYADIHYPQSAR